jgi:cytochrome P450
MLTVDVDPYSEEFLDDPFPSLGTIREAGRFVHLPSRGVWAVARHDDVAAVLRDTSRFSSAAGVGLTDLTREEAWRKPSILLEVDPPLHTRNRGVVARVLSPSALRSLQSVLDDAAMALVDQLVQLGTFDAVADVAEVFPTVVFPKAFGVDADARDHLLRYGSMVFNGMGPRNELFEAAMDGAGEVIGWITDACTRERLRPGSVGADIYDAADAAGVDESDAALLIRSFLSAGVDTTVSGLAFAVHRLATNPSQWDLLRADPSLARNAFEETVRIDAPVVGFYRTTACEVPVDDTLLPAGTKVLVFFAGANRDPRRWDDPDRFDIGRRTAGHLGYGFGPHVCVGMAVARMEAEALLKAMAARISTLQLVGPPLPRRNNSLRGLDSLPLLVTPVAP